MPAVRLHLSPPATPVCERITPFDEAGRDWPFKSVDHVLQQRAVKLPKWVREELAEMVAAAEAGDEAGR